MGRQLGGARLRVRLLVIAMRFWHLPRLDRARPKRRRAAVSGARSHFQCRTGLRLSRRRAATLQTRGSAVSRRNASEVVHTNFLR